MIQSLSLSEKIGQMLIARIDLPPAFPESIPAEFVSRCGGVILFGGSVENVPAVLERLQQRCAIPLLVASDLERGPGQQVHGAPSFPYSRGLGEFSQRTGAFDLVYQSALQTGRVARALGIHQNYAPVADVHTCSDNPIIGIRAFHSDPDHVARCCRETIRGLRDGGMLSTVKHFPGHGDTRADSHVDLPVLELTRSQIEEVHLLPFAQSIIAGVDAVMIGHIAVPALDPSGCPASLSHIIVTRLLRQQMKFDGLIVTDAMNMGGITKHTSPSEAVILAIRSGCDQVLMPSDTKVISDVVEAIRAGRLSESLVDRAVERIMATKERLRLFAAPRGPAVCDDFALAEKVAAAVIDTRSGKLLPILDDAQVVFCLQQPHSLSWLVERLRSYAIICSLSDPPPSMSGRPLTVMTDLQPRAWSGMVGFPLTWKNWLEARCTERDQVISFGSPWLGVDSARNFTCAYSSSDISQRAIYKRLVEDR